MNTSQRRVEQCEHRRHKFFARRTICDLAAGFAGRQAAKQCEVDDSVCQACCRYALPSDAGLNPIVASVLWNAVEKTKIGPQNAVPHVEHHNARQFAMRWLTTSGEPPEQLPRARGRCDMAANNARQSQSSPLRIGLVGKNSQSGLGYQNRDIATHLPVDRWLVPDATEEDAAFACACRVDFAPADCELEWLESWLRGLDVVLFVERLWFSSLARIARNRGVRVVCVPNWEWLHPGLDWLDDVDVMLCPTKYTAQLMQAWRDRFRFPWQVACVPWPIDVDRFAFRRREVCRRFLFVNGAGGASAYSMSGQPPSVRRKGLEVLLAAARLAPEIPLLVYSQERDLPPLPPNVEFRPPPADNHLLYADGDVCVQPSHWEGLGLPLLECQAAGMPLITTAAPPMNEHQPLVTVPTRLRAMYLCQELCIPVALIEPALLAQVLRTVYGQNISLASAAARSFVEREHAWNTAGPQIMALLRSLVKTFGQPR